MTLSLEQHVNTTVSDSPYIVDKSDVSNNRVALQGRVVKNAFQGVHTLQHTLRIYQYGVSTADTSTAMVCFGESAWYAS